MKYRVCFQLALVGVSVAMLVGCSTTKTPSVAQTPAGQSTALGENSGGQTYGLNAAQGIQAASTSGAQTGLVASESVQSGHKVVNSLKAPENQVYYFSFNEFSVNAKDLPAIEVQASYLVQHPKAIVRLEGNTDDRGSREYNIGLGWRRDRAVEQILTQQGVAKHQIKMVSYGKERPAIVGDNDAVWALNRRVNLVYVRT